MRVCSQPGCPNLIPKAGRCTDHERAHDKARGRRQARGYNSKHDALRKEWEPYVATGTVECTRCHLPIAKGAPWHLDHDDEDRTQYRGPSHAHCNTAAGGRAAHR